MDNMKGSKLVLALTGVKTEFQDDLDKLVSKFEELCFFADEGEKQLILEALNKIVSYINDKEEMSESY